MKYTPTVADVLADPLTPEDLRKLLAENDPPPDHLLILVSSDHIRYGAAKGKECLVAEMCPNDGQIYQLGAIRSLPESEFAAPENIEPTPVTQDSRGRMIMAEHITIPAKVVAEYLADENVPETFTCEQVHGIPILPTVDDVKYSKSLPDNIRTAMKEFPKFSRVFFLDGGLTKGNKPQLLLLSIHDEYLWQAQGMTHSFATEDVFAAPQEKEQTQAESGLEELKGWPPLKWAHWFADNVEHLHRMQMLGLGEAPRKLWANIVDASKRFLAGYTEATLTRYGTFAAKEKEPEPAPVFAAPKQNPLDNPKVREAVKQFDRQYLGIPPLVERAHERLSTMSDAEKDALDKTVIEGATPTNEAGVPYYSQVRVVPMHGPTDFCGPKERKPIPFINRRTRYPS